MPSNTLWSLLATDQRVVGGDEGPFRDGRGGSDGLHDEKQHQSDDDDRVAVRDGERWRHLDDVETDGVHVMLADEQIAFDARANFERMEPSE